MMLHSKFLTESADISSIADVTERRASLRSRLALSARCIVGDDVLPGIWLVDISENGCQIFGTGGDLSIGQGIVIICPNGRDHIGNVTWASNVKAGVQFQMPMRREDISNLQTIRPTHALRSIAILDELTDNFGRRLLPLPDLRRIKKII